MSIRIAKMRTRVGLCMIVNRKVSKNRFTLIRQDTISVFILRNQVTFEVCQTLLLFHGQFHDCKQIFDED